MRLKYLLSVALYSSLLVGCAEDGGPEDGSESAGDGDGDGDGSGDGDGDGDGAGDGDGDGDGAGDGDGDGDGASGPSFVATVLPLLADRCGCHRGGDDDGDFIVDDNVAYENMVNHPSDQAPMDIVEPGSVENSYLYHKLVDTQDSVGGEGDQMPKGRNATPFNPAELGTVADWIEGGALP